VQKKIDMNNTDYNKAIAHLLECAVEASKPGGRLFSISDYLLQIGINDKSIKNIILDRIAYERLADVRDTERIFATPVTHSIIEKGGYLVYLENERKEAEREKIRKTKEENYYHWQGTLGKWYFKFRWLPFVFSLLALIVSIIALFCKD
jgi:hypothetical protein